MPADPREVLRRLEWRDGPDMYDRCPECRRYRHVGHTADCGLAAAIAALSAQPSGEGERAHRRVTEYDGAYWCLDCGAKWGALPGKPQMPARCSAAPTSPPASTAPAAGVEALREHLEIRVRTHMIHVDGFLGHAVGPECAYCEKDEAIRQYAEGLLAILNGERER